MHRDCAELADTSGQPQVFWATTNNIHCVYESVANALIEVCSASSVLYTAVRELTPRPQYGTGIANSGIPPPTSNSSLAVDEFPDRLRAGTQAILAAAQVKFD